MYSFLKAYLVLMKLLSLSQFYAPRFDFVTFSLYLTYQMFAVCKKRGWRFWVQLRRRTASF